MCVRAAARMFPTPVYVLQCQGRVVQIDRVACKASSCDLDSSWKRLPEHHSDCCILLRKGSGTPISPGPPLSRSLISQRLHSMPTNQRASPLKLNVYEGIEDRYRS